jgi:hypothetical protein
MNIFNPFRDEIPIKSIECEECLMDLSPDEITHNAAKCKVICFNLFFYLCVFIIFESFVYYFNRVENITFFMSV